MAGQVATYAAASFAKAAIDAASEQIRNNPQGVVSFLRPRRRKKRGGKKKGGRSNAGPRSNRPLALMDTMAVPAAYSNTIRNTAPRFRSVSGRYAIANREFATVVRSSVEYSVLQFTIQPGVSPAFKWLSKIANTHQKYRFTKLKFTYSPVCSTSTVGEISMAYALDPLDPTPQGMNELAQYPTVVSTNVYRDVSLTVDCSKSEFLFTRSGNVTSTDLKTYDFGQLFVASDLAVASTNIGRLWVDYEIELSTPKAAECPAGIISQQGTGDAYFFGAPTPIPGTTATVQASFTGTFRVNFTTVGIYFLSVSLIQDGVNSVTIDQGDAINNKNEFMMQSIASSPASMTLQHRVFINNPSFVVLEPGGAPTGDFNLIISVAEGSAQNQVLGTTPP